LVSTILFKRFFFQYVDCSVKLHYCVEFRSVPFRASELALPRNSECLGMSTFFRGITETVPSLFRGIFSERNSVPNPISNPCTQASTDSEPLVGFGYRMTGGTWRKLGTSQGPTASMSKIRPAVKSISFLFSLVGDSSLLPYPPPFQERKLLIGKLNKSFL
jgi:hypothetical protein